MFFVQNTRKVTTFELLLMPASFSYHLLIKPPPLKVSPLELTMFETYTSKSLLLKDPGVSCCHRNSVKNRNNLYSIKDYTCKKG